MVYTRLDTAPASEWNFSKVLHNLSECVEFSNTWYTPCYDREYSDRQRPIQMLCGIMATNCDPCSCRSWKFQSDFYTLTVLFLHRSPCSRHFVGFLGRHWLFCSLKRTFGARDALYHSSCYKEKWMEHFFYFRKNEIKIINCLRNFFQIFLANCRQFRVWHTFQQASECWTWIARALCCLV